MSLCRSAIVQQIQVCTASVRVGSNKSTYSAVCGLCLAALQASYIASVTCNCNSQWTIHAVKNCYISIVFHTLLMYLVAVTINGLHSEKNRCIIMMLFAAKQEY